MKYISDADKKGAVFTITRAEQSWIVTAVSDAILEAFITSENMLPSDMCFLIDINTRSVSFGVADDIAKSSLKKNDYPDLAIHLKNRSGLAADDAVAVVKKGNGVLLLATLQEIAGMCRNGLLS